MTVTVSVLVSFAPVQAPSDGATPDTPPQFRTPTPPSCPPYEHLESVLGATPHEFESRILRQRPAGRTKGPTVRGGALRRMRQLRSRTLMLRMPRPWVAAYRVVPSGPSFSWSTATAGSEPTRCHVVRPGAR
jgi:hypothetical protein